MVVGTVQLAQVSTGSIKNQSLRDGFLRWQCRVRQLAMRDNLGRPDAAISPDVTVKGGSQAIGQIITVLSKWGPYSKLPELQHMAKRTNDPAQRREKAIEFLSEYYYQHASEFSDNLTATFPPGSRLAAALLESGEIKLNFEAYNQRFELHCDTKRLHDSDALYQATWWHNVMFNPGLHPQTIVLAFEPDWDLCSADPIML